MAIATRVEAIAGRFAFHSDGDLFLRPRSPRTVFPTAKRGEPGNRQSSPPLRRCHSPGLGMKEGLRFSTSPRDTFQFIPAKSEGAGRLYDTSVREGCPGGTISMAKRFGQSPPQ
ncbi:unnamed protein product, partial [Durusdinium trenchii]